MIVNFLSTIFVTVILVWIYKGAELATSHWLWRTCLHLLVYNCSAVLVLRLRRSQQPDAFAVTEYTVRIRRMPPRLHAAAEADRRSYNASSYRAQGPKYKASVCRSTLLRLRVEISICFCITLLIREL